MTQIWGQRPNKGKSLLARVVSPIQFQAIDQVLTSFGSEMSAKMPKACLEKILH